MDSIGTSPVSSIHKSVGTPADLEKIKLENEEALQSDAYLKKRKEPEGSIEDPNIEELVTKEEMDVLIQKRKSKPLLQGCNSIENYLYLNKIHEGSFGVVFRAKDKLTGKQYAIKNVKIGRNVWGFPFSAIRELNVLMSIKHPNVIEMKEVVTGSKIDKIYVVMEYMENELKHLIENMEGRFTVPQIKCLMKQLLKAVEHLHSRYIIHRDLKTSNLLFGKDGILKVCDFGLARTFSEKGRPGSPHVVTLWYRAPELLIGSQHYGFPVDMWSVGCIFAEIILKKPLFQGATELEQLDLILRCLGMPNDHAWPEFKELLQKRNIIIGVKETSSRLAEKFAQVNTAGGISKLI